MKKKNPLKSDLARIAKTFGFQHEMILEFRDCGLIDKDLSRVTKDHPFLARMAKIIGNRPILRIQIDGFSDETKKWFLQQESNEMSPLEEDILDVFVDLYRAQEEIDIDKILKGILYKDAITPEVRKRASQLRHVAAERVRRERKKLSPTVFDEGGVL